MASKDLTPDADVETRSYDRAGRLTEVRNAKAGVTLSFATYAYDPVGNPTQMTTTEGTTAYAYDGLDRLTEACFTGGCSDFVRYTYDPVGNRQTEVKPVGTTSYSYNAVDQLTSRSGPGGSVAYAYDGNGNQTQAGTRTFAWDLADRLVSTTESGSTITYGYDGDGTRLRATAGSTTTDYLWDANFGLPRLALERDGAGNPLRSYLHGNQPISMDTGGSSFYLQRDGIGSTVNLTSATGVTQWTYGYEPFGLPRTQTQNQPGAPANPIRFAGEQLDATGLYHLRARQYDPGSGRFLSLDPLAPALTDPYVAAYAYANNRPTVLVDPSGMGAVHSKDEGLGFGWRLGIAIYETIDTAIVGGATIAIGGICIGSEYVTAGAATVVCVPAIVAGTAATAAVGAAAYESWGEVFNPQHTKKRAPGR